MPGIKDLKKRITSVKNTQQTTRAMKMVSAAKLRRAQDAILNHRPYAKEILNLIFEISKNVEVKGHFPLLRREGVPTEDGGKQKVLLVVVSSDRGLCGGFNSYAIKTALRTYQECLRRGEEAEFAFVGRKAYDFFKTKNVKISDFYSELGGKVSFAKAKKLADALIARYETGEVDQIKFIFNEFINAVSQQVRVEEFLPLRAPEGSNEAISGASTEELPNYIVKPNPEFVLHELLSKSFHVQSFRILLESQAGEHGARMSAMENATKNAGEMIRKLTLQFNKQRQAGITKELLEIIAGSESQKG